MADMYDWTGNLYDQVAEGKDSVMPGSVSDFFGNLTSGDYGKAFKTIQSVLSGKSGAGTAGQLAALSGMSYLMNQLTGGSGTNPNAYAGYKGKIPEYTVERVQNTIPTTVTNTAGEVVPRRPGSGGINYFQPITYTKKAADGGLMDGYAQGGISTLGGYSDGGRLLRGPGDGVSDSIPASIEGKQPARLADGEFVIPARIVSELGNGSTEAGARKLYAMMDRIQKSRGKTVGKQKVAVNSKADKHLPA
jgi:hypothetical protein